MIAVYVFFTQALHFGFGMTLEDEKRVSTIYTTLNNPDHTFSLYCHIFIDDRHLI